MPSLRRSAPKRVCVISGCLPEKSQASVRAGSMCAAPVDGAHGVVEARVGRRSELRHHEEHAAADARFQAGAIRHFQRARELHAERAFAHVGRRRSCAARAANKSPKPRGLDATNRCVTTSIRFPPAAAWPATSMSATRRQRWAASRNGAASAVRPLARSSAAIAAHSRAESANSACACVERRAGTGQVFARLRRGSRGRNCGTGIHPFRPAP